MRIAAVNLANAQATAYKRIAPGQIAKHYTVRDPKFIERAFKIFRAHENDDLNKIFAVVGSSRIKNKYHGAFTGWKEAYTGVDERGMGIWTIGARNGDFKNKIDRRFILTNDSPVPTDMDPLLSNIPARLRKYAMIDRMARTRAVEYSKGGRGSTRLKRLDARGRHIPPGRFSATKTPVFKTGEGDAWGLYRFKGGLLPTKENPFPLIEPVRLFQKERKRPPRPVDWQGNILAKVAAEFPPGYVWHKYFSRAFQIATVKAEGDAIKISSRIKNIATGDF